jgi:cytochrome c553
MARRSLLVVVVFVAALISTCAPARRTSIGVEVRARAAPERRPIALAAVGETSSSELVLARALGRDLAFVADEDEGAIHTVDLGLGIEIARTELEGRPSRALFLPNGRLAVSLRDGAAVVVLAAFDPNEPLTVERRIATELEPIALAATDDALWVASGWGRALEGFSLATWERIGRHALGREPRTLAIARGKGSGTAALVGYLAEERIDQIDLATGEVVAHVLEIREREETLIMKPRPRPPGSTERWEPPKVRIPRRVGRQVHAIVETRSGFVVPHLEVAPGATGVRPSGYGSAPTPVSFALARIDASPQTSEAGRLSIHDRAGDCPLPRGATTADAWLVVACLGFDRIFVSDLAHPDRSALHPIAGGPSSVAAIDGTVVVYTRFDRDLKILPTSIFAPLRDHGARATPQVIPLSRGPVAPSPEVEAGRRLFHAATDARISTDARACASCHAEGRDDGLVWPTPKGPRQTISLAGRCDREGPFGWQGEHATFEDHLVRTIANLGGSGLPIGDRRALAAYVRAIPPPPRARVPSKAERRGARLFASRALGCAGCHGGARSRPSSRDPELDFRPPNLRFVSGSAPYFHDGRYPDLRSLLEERHAGDEAQLSTGDLDALEGFLRTL